jgi:hypothetical protein
MCEDKHRWALVNLALLNWGTDAVRKLVLDGLYHPGKNIQEAAALSIGLFDDPDFLRAASDFMERDRLLYVKEGMRVFAARISEFTNRLAEKGGRTKKPIDQMR